MFQKINIVPRWIIFLIDSAVCAFAMVFAHLVRYNLSVEAIDLQVLGGNVLILVLINSIVFINFRTYAGIIRYTGIQDALRICYAILMTTSVLFFIGLVSTNTGGALNFPTVTLIIYSLFSFLFLISYRVIVKYVFAYLRNYKMDRKTITSFKAC